MKGSVGVSLASTPALLLLLRDRTYAA